VTPDGATPVQHPRLHGLKEEKKSKPRAKSPKTKKQPKVRSTPSPGVGLHPSPPKIGATPPPDTVNKVPPVKFRIDQSASPVVMDQSEPSILPVENDLSKNGHSSPLITDESKPSKKRKLPNCDDTNDQKKSPKNSTPPPPVEPVQPVANHVQEPVKMENEEQKPEKITFSGQVRFRGSVRNDPNQPVNVPSTPKPDEIELAAEGGELEGVTGVRDTNGDFHRWHEEITLDPDGTEPFMHILPYVDVDLELL